MTFVGTAQEQQAFSERVWANQKRLAASLKRTYDFIVCGSGSSGSVVARRLAENPNVDVLLLEAGGSDEVPEVTDPGRWLANLGSERDWGFSTEPNPALNGRRISPAMGKVCGGGSSVNVMGWARGHKDDWDWWASESGNAAWGYDAVLNTYRRIEDWHGTPDPKFRGTGGQVFVAPASDPHPVALATVEGAQSIGIAAFDHANGQMMESGGGTAIGDACIRDGKRASIFRTYTFPYMDRSNLTVLTGCLMRRVTFDGSRATGVEVNYDGQARRIEATGEVVLSLGAINTPKVLMQSGIGDETELRAAGIPVVQNLSGVGQNYQDHVAFDCVWECEDLQPARNNGSEVVVFGQTQPGLTSPDVFIWQMELPVTTAEVAARYNLPANGWTLRGAISHPKSRGRLRLTGPDPQDPILIESNTLGDPADLETAIKLVELTRDIGNSAPLRQYVSREALPGKLSGDDLEAFVRDAATTYNHSTGTAKMGRDETSVVNGELQVHGIENLRVADGSIMPRITNANTMAPCVMIGERAAEFLKDQHRL
jgi:choline dehydrogenase